MAIHLDWTSAKQGGPVARAVCRYHDLVQSLADQAKLPGFSDSDMDALAQEVEPRGFQRFGNFLEVQDWDQYREMMTGWVKTSRRYTTKFIRMTEVESLVFLELQETHSSGTVNSVSIYEFNQAGKINRLHVYLQMARVG
jgi:hypothetical protein